MSDRFLHPSKPAFHLESTTLQDFADVQEAFAGLRLPGRVRWFIREIASDSDGCEPSGIYIVVRPPCTLRLPSFRLDRNRGGVRLMTREEDGEPVVCRFPTLAAALATLRREVGARVANVEIYKPGAYLMTSL